MTLLGELLLGKRALATPGIQPSNPNGWWNRLEEPSLTGVSVTERSSLGLSALYQGITLIAGMVSVLPCHVYERSNGARREATENKLYNTVHDEPNPESTWSNFVQAQYLNKLTYGNRYAENELTNGGKPTGRIWHLPSHLVRVRRVYKRLGGGVTFDPMASTPEDRARGGALVYEVRGTFGGEPVYLDQSEMIHVPDVSFDGLVGLSRVLLAKESIAVGIARLRSVAAIYGNDSSPGGVLERPKDAPSLSPAGERSLIGAFESTYGGPNRKGRLAVLQEGTTFKPVAFSPKDSMVIEAAQLSSLEMAQYLNLNPYWFGIPGDSEKYANLEQEMTLLVVRTLLPHMRLDEQEFNRKLFSGADRGRYFVEYDTKGLMRGDSAARAAFYEKLINLGILTPDQAAAIENLPPVPADQGGSTYRTNRTFGAASIVLSELSARPTTGPVPGTEPIPTDEGGSPDGADATTDTQDPSKPAQKPPKRAVSVEAFRPVLEAGWRRAMGKETAAIRKALAGDIGSHGEIREALAEFYRQHQKFAADVVGLPVAETVARHHGELLAIVADEALVSDAVAKIGERLDQWDREGASQEAARSLAAMQ